MVHPLVNRKIVKKKTNTFKRHQSDRYDKVKVCIVFKLDFSTNFNVLFRNPGENQKVLITDLEESSVV